MNDDQLNKLFAAARQDKPDTARAELAFETRLLARLRAGKQAPAAPWFPWAWRLVPVFAAVVIALGVWNYFAPVNSVADLTASGEDAMLVALLAGEE